MTTRGNFQFSGDTENEIQSCDTNGLSELDGATDHVRPHVLVVERLKTKELDERIHVVQLVLHRRSRQAQPTIGHKVAAGTTGDGAGLLDAAEIMSKRYWRIQLNLLTAPRQERHGTSECSAARWAAPPYRRASYASSPPSAWAV